MFTYVLSHGGMPSVPIGTYETIDPWYRGKNGSAKQGD